MSDLDPLKFRSELADAVVRYASAALPRGVPKTARLARAFEDLLAREKESFVTETFLEALRFREGTLPRRARRRRHLGR